MDKLQMAKALLITEENAYTKGGQTVTAYGIAVSDSVDGLVRINLGGDTVSPEDDQAIEVETTFSVREGDEVIVSLIGADGTGKTPIVIGVVGRMDELAEDISRNYSLVLNEEYSGTDCTITALIYHYSDDITDDYEPRQFVWYKKTEDGKTALGTGKSITVSIEDMGYGGVIRCEFSSYIEGGYLTTYDGRVITTFDNTPIVVADTGDITLDFGLAQEIAVYDTENKPIAALKLEADNAVTNTTAYYKISATQPSAPSSSSSLDGWMTLAQVQQLTPTPGTFLWSCNIITHGDGTEDITAVYNASTTWELHETVLGVKSRVEGAVQTGNSNIETLSSTMYQDVNGVNIYNDISEAGKTYAFINGEAFEIKAVTEAETINGQFDTSVASFGLYRANIAGIDGTKYWAVEDLRTGSGGTATMSQLYYGDSETTDIVLSFPFVAVLSVSKNNVVLTEDTDYTVDSITNSVSFQTAPLVGDSILIKYTTTAPVFAYTNGLRGSGDKGPYSVSSGLYNIARGAYSEAHGNLNIANGYASYVEGYNNIASGEMQRVFGKSNIEDTQNKYIEIVGNGRIISSDGNETFLINGEVAVTLSNTPDMISGASVTKNYLFSEVSNALSSHGVRIVSTSKVIYDSAGTPHGYWYIHIKADTPFDYPVTFVCHKNTGTTSPKTLTLNAGQTETSKVGVTSAGYNNYSIYSVPFQSLDVIDYITADANEISLSGPITYFGNLFGDFPLTISYVYSDSMVRGNARTLDWDGNMWIAGKMLTNKSVILNAVNPAAGSTYNLTESIEDYTKLGFIIGRTATTGGICNYQEIPVDIFKLLFTSSSRYLRLEENAAYVGVYYYSDTQIYIQSKSNINYLAIYGIK